MTNESPAVSVLISAYQVTPYIAEALDSVFAQTVQDFEIILVNDGCPDTENLESALAPYLSRIHYIKQANGGPSAARNTAIRAARAPLVALLDGDDAWMPDYLEYQLEYLRTRPDTALVYSNMLTVGGIFDGTLVMEQTPSDGEVTFLSLLLQRCVVLNGVTMRKDIAFRAGLWDPEMRHSEDFDLWVRIACEGRIEYHRKPLVRRRVRESSLSASSEKMLRGQLRVYAKVEPLSGLGEADRDLVRAKVRSVQAELDVETGWQAVFRGDRQTAIDRWKAAQISLPSAKLALALRCLRWFPGPAFSALQHYGRKRTSP